MVGALGVSLLVGAPTTAAAAAQTNTPDLLMPGDRWPTLADANSTGTLPQDSKDTGSTTDTASPKDAGSLDTVTCFLA